MYSRREEEPQGAWVMEGKPELMDAAVKQNKKKRKGLESALREKFHLFIIVFQ